MCSLTNDDLYMIYEKLDKNGADHTVSLDKLHWLLERIGVRTSIDDLQLLVGKSCLDAIDFFFFFDAVINGCSNKHDRCSSDNSGNNSCSEETEEDREKEVSSNSETDLIKAFKVFDINEDGFISRDELQIVLSRLGLRDHEIDGRDCERIISAYDKNYDGQLDFEEFKMMMKLSNSNI